MSSSKIEHKLPLEVLEGLAIDQKPIIVMSEGNDPSVIAGAIAAFNSGICQIVLLGSKIRIKTECKNLGLNLPREISIINPEKSELLSEFEKDSYFLICKLCSSLSYIKHSKKS